MPLLGSLALEPLYIGRADDGPGIILMNLRRLYDKYYDSTIGVIYGPAFRRTGSSGSVHLDVFHAEAA